MSGPQTKHVRAPRASEAARAGASPVGPATARLLRRPAGPRTLVLSPTQAFAGTAPVCRERRPRRQPTSTLRFAGRRQDTLLRLLGTAHLRRKVVATRWRTPRDLVSNQVEMSSPWCGGGLPGPPRRPRNTGQARGLDAKPGRPAAGWVTAPLWTTRPWRRGGAHAKAPSRVLRQQRRSETGLQRIRRQSQHPLPHLRRQRPVRPPAPQPVDRSAVAFRLEPAHQTPKSGAASPPAAPLPSPPPTSPRPPASTPPCVPARLRSTPFAPLPDRVRHPTEHEPKEDISTLVRPEVAPACLTRNRCPIYLHLGVPVGGPPIPCLAAPSSSKGLKHVATTRRTANPT